MARMVKVLSTILLLSIITLFGADTSNSDVLVLFDSYGLLYKDVVDGEQIPNGWSILQISAQNGIWKRRVLIQSTYCLSNFQKVIIN